MLRVERDGDGPTTMTFCDLLVDSGASRKKMRRKKMRKKVRRKFPALTFF